MISEAPVRRPRLGTAEAGGIIYVTYSALTYCVAIGGTEQTRIVIKNDLGKFPGN